MVQVGNETNDALCGHMGDSNMSAIWSNLHGERIFVFFKTRTTQTTQFVNAIY
jgi:arabinogalactan endo-1,4-beta-galactosidase